MSSRVEDAQRGRALRHGCSCIVHVYIYIASSKLSVARVFNGFSISRCQCATLDVILGLHQLAPVDQSMMVESSNG